MTPSRPLPHCLADEEYLISCCLMDGAEVVAKCIGAGIKPQTFYDPKHGVMFDCMLTMTADQKPVSIDTVAAELRTSKQLELIGGFAFIAQVSSRIPTTAQVGFFIEKVRDSARLREIIRNATSLVEECYEFSGDWAPLKQRTERVADSFNEQEQARSWKVAVEEAEALTRERMKPPSERDTGGMELSWGIPDFDKFFQPIEPGELIIIGGYTSSGKSSLLRQIAWGVASAGHSSLIQTIEVRDTEEAINLSGHISGIRSRARLHELHRKDQAQLIEAFQKMKVSNFGVGHQDTSWAQMQARARAFKRKHGLKFLGADYLQIMDEVKILERGVRPDFAIGCVTSGAKKFATNEQVAVCLLSGFNREYIKGNREPILSDLEGSSNIEKDASRVLLIHVPSEYTVGGAKFTQSTTADPVDQPRFYVKIIQAKGRNQGTASVSMMFHRESKTFQQITR